ncbi:MAG: primosomal protein N' [Kiritimatiellia bacterium]
MFVSVAIDLALDRTFTYSVPVELTEKLRVGQLLRVPFSGRIVRGFALALTDVPPDLPAGSRRAEGAQALLPGMASPPPPSPFKAVMAIEDESPFFSAAVIRLVRWMAAYTASPVETCLHAAVPGAVLRPGAKPKERLYVEAVGKGRVPAAVKLTPRQKDLLDNLVRVGGGWLQQVVKEFATSVSTLRLLEKKGVVSIDPHVARRDPLAGRHVMPTRPRTLNPRQAAALDAILAPSSSADPDGPSRPAAAPRPVLLFGVTGSGKTEVYLQAIGRLLAEGKGAIVLVPEISLTPQTVQRFAGRFGDRIAVLHSALSDGERYDEWHRIRTGEARVVVGPRSAIFAPVRNLGLIVVDEEHDPSYKQEETPRYHARDVAVMRAFFEGARIVLGSATPSLESWANVQAGKYALASIPNRVAGRALPDVRLVDMDDEMRRLGHVPIYSSLLLEAIRDRLARGEQTILFLNRRGYSRVLECPGCGWVAECPNCSIAYTYHRADDCLRCHVCGSWMKLPTVCPTCHHGEFDFTGIGTQRAEAALKACLPHARILRMDADSTSRKFSHDDILGRFRALQADVLLGTQMIAKGLDFPNVTLVGVLNADTALNRPDPRASERTYQLLAQVSGRAGRAEKPGEVYIQTFQPDAPAIAAAASNRGFAAFAEDELAERASAYLPPYCRLCTLVFRAKSEALARDWSRLYAEALAGWAARVNGPAGDDGPFRVSGAEEAALAKADGWYRYQIVLRAPAVRDVTAAVKWIAGARPPPDGLRITYDVDAQNMA